MKPVSKLDNRGVCVCVLKIKFTVGDHGFALLCSQSRVLALRYQLIQLDLLGSLTSSYRLLNSSALKSKLNSQPRDLGF